MKLINDMFVWRIADSMLNQFVSICFVLSKDFHWLTKTNIEGRDAKENYSFTKANRLGNTWWWRTMATDIASSILVLDEFIVVRDKDLYTHTLERVNYSVQRINENNAHVVSFLHFNMIWKSWNYNFFPRDGIVENHLIISIVFKWAQVQRCSFHCSRLNASLIMRFKYDDKQRFKQKKKKTDSMRDSRNLKMTARSMKTSLSLFVSDAWIER